MSSFSLSSARAMPALPPFFKKNSLLPECAQKAISTFRRGRALLRMLPSSRLSLSSAQDSFLSPPRKPSGVFLAVLEKRVSSTDISSIENREKRHRTFPHSSQADTLAFAVASAEILRAIA
jgi:hypothetical protein